MKLIKPDKRPLSIALIGMPRSGSTITGSFFNSLDGGFVVGEPHSMIVADRPFGHDWPAYIDTDAGLFKLYPKGEVDPLRQIEVFALINGFDIYGFKEVCTVKTDPSQIVELYGDRLDAVFVLMREPRKVFRSMTKNTPEGSLPTSPLTFYEWYRSIFEFCDGDYPFPVHIIYYEQFIKNPERHINEVAGWEFEGSVSLRKFPGSGDLSARGSKVVRAKDIGIPYKGNLLDGMDKLYEEFLSARGVNGSTSG